MTYLENKFIKIDIKSIYSSYIFILISLFPFQYLLKSAFHHNLILYDDLLVFSLIPFFILYLKKDLYLLFYFTFLFIYTIWNLFFNLNPYGILGDMQWFVKPLVLIYGMIYLLENVYTKRLNQKLVKILLLLSFVGALYGLIQFFAWNLFAIWLPLADIKYIMSLNLLFGSDIPVGRVAGIWGHQNFCGLVSMVVTIYGIISKRYIYLLTGVFGLVISFSRWPIFLAFISFIFLSKNIKFSYLRKYSLSMMTVLIIVGVYFFNDINKVYGSVYDGYSQTPKMYGIMKTVELLQLYPFGVGLGMYGTRFSANSKIYNELNFRPQIQEMLLTATSGIESMYAILISQTGIVGFILFVGIFLRHFLSNSNPVFKLKFLLILLLPIYYNLYFPSFLVYNLVLFNKNQ